jgi:hypothetical protein
VSLTLRDTLDRGADLSIGNKYCANIAGSERRFEIWHGDARKKKPRVIPEKLARL